MIPAVTIRQTTTGYKGGPGFIVAWRERVRPYQRMRGYLATRAQADELRAAIRAGADPQTALIRIANGQRGDVTASAISELASKAGHARAAKLSPERRSQIAAKAAAARWGKAKAEAGK